MLYSNNVANIIRFCLVRIAEKIKTTVHPPAGTFDIIITVRHVRKNWRNKGPEIIFCIESEKNYGFIQK